MRMVDQKVHFRLRVCLLFVVTYLVGNFWSPPAEPVKVKHPDLLRGALGGLEVAVPGEVAPLPRGRRLQLQELHEGRDAEAHGARRAPGAEKTQRRHLLKLPQESKVAQKRNEDTERSYYRETETQRRHGVQQKSFSLFFVS